MRSVVCVNESPSALAVRVSDAELQRNFCSSRVIDAMIRARPADPRSSSSVARRARARLVDLAGERFVRSPVERPDEVPQHQLEAGRDTRRICGLALARRRQRAHLADRQAGDRQREPGGEVI